MPQRFSGEVTIDVAHMPPNYRVSVAAPGLPTWRGELRPPRDGFGAGVAHDSPAAFDRVAYDALGHAAEREPGFAERGETTESRGAWVIARARPPGVTRANDAGGEDDGVTICRVGGNADLVHVLPGEHGPQPCFIELDARSGDATADWTPERGHAVPQDVFDGHVRRWPIPPLTAASANALLDELRPLFVVVVAGYSTGRGGRPAFDDDALQAVERIGERVDGWRGDVVEHYASARDYYAPIGGREAQCDAFGLRPGMGPDELAAVIDREEAAVEREGHVVPGVAEYIERLHGEAHGGGSRANGASRSEWHVSVKPGADVYARALSRSGRLYLIVVRRGEPASFHRFTTSEPTSRHLISHRRAIAKALRERGVAWSAMEPIEWGRAHVKWPEFPDPSPGSERLHAPHGRGPKPRAPAPEKGHGARANHTLAAARADFLRDVVPNLRHRDVTAAREAWSGYIDELHRSRRITDKQVNDWTMDEAAVKRALGLGASRATARAKPAASGRSVTLAWARADFLDEVVPNLRHHDLPAAREAWSSYIDDLHRSGRITDKQVNAWTMDEPSVKRAIDRARSMGNGRSKAPAAREPADAVVVSFEQRKSGVHRYHEAVVRVRDGAKAPAVYRLTVNAHGVVEEMPGELSDAARSAVIAAVRQRHGRRR